MILIYNCLILAFFFLVTLVSAATTAFSQVSTSVNYSPIFLQGGTVKEKGEIMFLIQTTNKSSDTLLDVSFDITLPAGGEAVVHSIVRPPSGCGRGILVAKTGSSKISYTGGSILTSDAFAGGTCQILVFVTGVKTGDYNIETELSSSTFTSTVKKTALLKVRPNPLTAIASPNKSLVTMGSEVEVTYTITNPNKADAAESEFTFLSNMSTISSLFETLSNSCGGTIGKNSQGRDSINNFSLSAETSCELKTKIVVPYINVGDGAIEEVFNFLSDNLSAKVGGFDTSVTNIFLGNIEVLQTPDLTMNFTPTKIEEGESSRLRLTIKNSAGYSASDLSFGNILPTEIKVASVPNISDNCRGTLTANADGSEISYSGGQTDANSNCIIEVDITSEKEVSILRPSKKLRVMWQQKMDQRYQRAEIPERPH